MSLPFARTLSRIVVPVFVVLAVVGCGGRSKLPATVIVELPDGTTVEVDQGAGIASLENSAWQFFQTSGSAQGMAFLTVSFGEGGTLDRFENNTIAPEIFGSTIYFDGERHDTSQAGISYAASTYGAETADGTGFAFEGKMTAFMAGIQAGFANLDAAGTFDPDDPDTMTGIFSFMTEITLPIDIPGAEVDDEFSFIAHRVVE